MNFKRVNTLNFIRTDQKNEVAWVSYYNTADMTINARHLNEKWVESAVLIKEKDCMENKTSAFNSYKVRSLQIGIKGI